MRCFNNKKLFPVWVIIVTVATFLFNQADIIAETKSQSVDELKKMVFNFDEVEPGFYRSGFLTPESYTELKKLGVKTVINFIDRPWSQCLNEKDGLAKLGIETVSIPWNGFDKPKDADVNQFLTTARDNSKRPILIHCKRGAERTGLMVACWRIAENHWTADQALDEMKNHHFRYFWYGHLSRYLYEFAKRYGQKKDYSTNIFTQAKVNFLYGIYRIRKLNPFLWAHYSCSL